MNCILFFFFKQKTAYEMLSGDWSSDVCSADLIGRAHADHRARMERGPHALRADAAGRRRERTPSGRTRRAVKLRSVAAERQDERMVCFGGCESTGGEHDADSDCRRTVLRARRDKEGRLTGISQMDGAVPVSEPGYLPRELEGKKFRPASEGRHGVDARAASRGQLRGHSSLTAAPRVRAPGRPRPPGGPPLSPSSVSMGPGLAAAAARSGRGYG